MASRYPFPLEDLNHEHYSQHHPYRINDDDDGDGNGDGNDGNTRTVSTVLDILRAYHRDRIWSQAASSSVESSQRHIAAEDGEVGEEQEEAQETYDEAAMGEDREDQSTTENASRQRQSRRQRTERSQASERTTVINRSVRTMYMFWKHGFGSQAWHWLFMFIQTMWIATRFVLVKVAKGDYPHAVKHLATSLSKWVVVFTPCWITSLLLIGSLVTWLMRDIYKYSRSVARDRRRLKLLRERYQQHLERHNRENRLQHSGEIGGQDIEMGDISLDGNGVDDVAGDISEGEVEQKSENDDNDGIGENEIIEEEGDGNNDNDGAEISLLRDINRSRGSDIDLETSLVDTADQSFLSVQSEQQVEQSLGEIPEYPRIIRSSRSLRRRHRKCIDRFYAYCFAVGLFVFTSLLVIISLQWDQLIRIQLKFISVPLLAYIILQTVAFIIFGVHILRFVRSAVWAYIYASAIVVLSTAFVTMFHLNLTNVIDLDYIVVCIPLFVVQVFAVLWSLRFILLSIHTRETTDESVRGGRTSASCIMITSNSNNRMSVISALWSLNSCTNLNHLTLEQRKQYRLRTCLDAVFSLVIQLPLDLFIFLMSYYEPNDDIKPFKVFIIFAPILFFEIACFSWITFRDRIVLSMLSAREPSIEDAPTRSGARPFAGLHRLALGIPGSMDTTSDMETIVNILRAIARGQTEELASANGMTREQLIQQGLMRLTLQHLNGQQAHSDDHPVNPQLLDMLPTFSYNKKHNRNEDDGEEEEEETCPICLCLYDEGDNLRMLPCFHKYHQACIDQWFSSQDTCPNCKMRIDSGSLLGGE